jgi:hypothetical protein
MHPFLNWLLTHHDAHGCLTATPRRSRWNIKCSIQWPKDSAFRLLDCDQCPDFRQGQGGKRPDFLLFWERPGQLLIVVLELTGGAVEPDKRDQIAAGLRILEGYLAQFNRGPRAYVYALILHSGSMRSANVDYFQQPLPFRGKRLWLIVNRCGDKLKKILEDWVSGRVPLTG